MHDLLSYLAEEMIRLNKEKRRLQREFLGWLTKELGIQQQPDKDGRVGIDAFKNKSLLLNYPGEYQKEGSELKPETFKRLLLENQKHCIVRLSEAVLAMVTDEYEKRLKEVLPLQRRLRLTDELIDQIVYRLYGLTEEEKRIVEGLA